MAYEADAVRYITDWLEGEAQHVADIVAGPKREQWFNAESFAALWRYNNIDQFVVYGEQTYSTILKETPFRDALNDESKSKLPDIVAFTPIEGNKYDIPFVVEAKVISRNESESKRKASLEKLREALTGAKGICGNAAAVGIVYLVAIAGEKVDPLPFFNEIGRQIDDVFVNESLVWLRKPAALHGLHLRATSFAYPACHVSVGLAAFHL